MVCPIEILWGCNCFCLWLTGGRGGEKTGKKTWWSRRAEEREDVRVDLKLSKNQKKTEEDIHVGMQDLEVSQNGGTPKFKLDHLVLKPMVTLGSLIPRNHHLNPFDRTMLVVPEISSSLTAPACQVLLRPSDSLQGNSPSRTSLE